MRQHFNRTVLIICEGEGTEPSYFKSIRDKVIDSGINVNITISPKPRQESNPEVLKRTKRPIRTLIKVSESNEKRSNLYEVEEKYSAQPVRYVREAQKGLEDGTYDEVWAVFDKDGHPKHKEAFELANSKVHDKSVNIGFSSIAFEHWILLHFEFNDFAFKKSRCREGREFFNCGTDQHPKDCKGSECICGYIIKKEFFHSDWSKNSLSIKELPSSQIAIENSAKLRTRMLAQSDTPNLYELNPITTIDKLVFSLNNLPIVYQWIEHGEDCVTRYLTFSLKRVQSKLRVKISNNKEARYLINEGDFMLLNSAGEYLSVCEKIYLDREGIEFNVDPQSICNFTPVYFAYKCNEQLYYITDI